jgi:hypothetical protein
VIGVRRVTEHVLPVASVDVLAGDLALMTEMFTSTGAELALFTCPPQRLHADRVANSEIADAGTQFSDASRDLVAMDDRADGRDACIDPLALDHVKV